MLAALIDGMNDSGELGGTGAAGVRRDANGDGAAIRNGSNLSTALSITELCWGDVGLLLSMPRQGLGNSAIASVATWWACATSGANFLGVSRLITPTARLPSGRSPAGRGTSAPPGAP